jgi:hypothetical protein
MKISISVAPFNRTHLLFTCRARPEQALTEWLHAFEEGQVRFPRGYTHVFAWDRLLEGTAPDFMEGEEWDNNLEFWDEFAVPVQMQAWINEVLVQARSHVSISSLEIRQPRRGYPRWALEAMLKTLPRCQGVVSRETLYREIEALLPLESTRDIDFPYGIC